MARFYRKKWFIGLIAILSGVFVLFVALPVLGSMRLVETQLIVALEQLTGNKAEFTGQPQIGVFPRLHVKIKDLTLTPKNDVTSEPVFKAEQVRLDLSAWSVINGEIFVQNTRLVRPSLKIPKTNGGKVLPQLLSGDLYNGLRTAEILVKQNPSEADLTSIRRFTIGPVSIEGGAIHFGNLETANQEVPMLSSINGTISAVELNGPMRIDLMGIWKGENVSLDTTISNFLSLAVGGSSNLNLSFQSAVLTGSFSGNISIGEHFFAEGQTAISTPSLTTMLSWVDQDILVSERIGNISIDADLRARNSRFYFDQANVTLDDKVGTGNLEIVLEKPVPAVNATLAFDTLNLQAILNGLSHGEAADGINMTVSDDVVLDLRLSANTATLEPFNMQNVAASLQIKSGTIGIDINDATLFGGQVQAGLRLNKTENYEADTPPNAELKILASNIDANDLFALVEWQELVLDGPLTLSVITEGPLVNWERFTNASNGTITLRTADINIDGFSLERFLADLDKSQFFPLAFNGSSAVSVLEAKGVITSGNIRIEDFKARLGENRIDLSGLYAHTARSLAMVGSIVAVNENGAVDENAKTTNFFVGGSPIRPFISPIIPGTLPDLR